MTLHGITDRLRRLLRGDIMSQVYEFRCRVRGLDFSWVTEEQLGLAPERGYRYSNSGGPELSAVLKKLIISPEDVALDAGCGKGGALITLKRFPFRRVDGLEISARLIEIAQRNLARSGLTGRIHQADAAQFTDFDDYTFIYMYNPFPRPVMKAFMANLAASLRDKPRPLTIVYKNPAFDEEIMACGLFTQTATYQPHDLAYTIYRTVEVAPIRNYFVGQMIWEK